MGGFTRHDGLLTPAVFASERVVGGDDQPRPSFRVIARDTVDRINGLDAQPDVMWSPQPTGERSMQTSLKGGLHLGGRFDRHASY